MNFGRALPPPVPPSFCAPGLAEARDAPGCIFDNRVNFPLVFSRDPFLDTTTKFLLKDVWSLQTSQV